MKTELLTTFANGIDLKTDGWADIAPYGDYPSMALRYNPATKKMERFKAIQRIDKEAVKTMVTEYQNARSGVTRFTSSRPLFLGHPDVPGNERRFPDHNPKGVFANLADKGSGLVGEPILLPEGEALVAQNKYFLSGRWEADELCGNDAEGNPIYRATKFLSAGLVTNPHLPVEMLNEKNDMEETFKEKLIKSLTAKGIKTDGLTEEKLLILFENGDYPGHEFHGNQYAEGGGGGKASAASLDAHVASKAALESGTAKDNKVAAEMHIRAAESHAAKGNIVTAQHHLQMAEMHKSMARGPAADRAPAAEMANQKQQMKKETLIALAARAGVTIANDGDDAAIETALTASMTAGAARKTEFDNERSARIDREVGLALTDGRITGAEKPDWERRLKGPEFANELQALTKLPKKVQTQSRVGDRTDIKPEDMTPQVRAEFLNSALDNAAKENGLDRRKDYPKVFAIVQKARPDLFKGAKVSDFRGRAVVCN